MSTFVEVSVRCASCGHVYVGEAATGLHVSRSPEIREALLRGELHRSDCPACGSPNVLHNRTFVYTDFDRWLWITTYPSSGLRYRGELEARADASWDDVMRRGAPEFVSRDWAPRFTRRVVFGLNALREKVLVLEAGLDDRLLEAFKLMIWRDMRLGAMRPGAELWFEDANDEGLVFTHVTPPGPDQTRVGRTFSVRREGFEALDRAAVLASTPELAEGLIVDWRALMFEPQPLPERFKQDLPMPDPPMR